MVLLTTDSSPVCKLHCSGIPESLVPRRVTSKFAFSVLVIHLPATQRDEIIYPGCSPPVPFPLSFLKSCGFIVSYFSSSLLKIARVVLDFHIAESGRVGEIIAIV